MADALAGAAGGAATGASVAGPYGALVGGVLGATGLLGGGSKTSGGGGAAPSDTTAQTNRQDQTSRQDVSLDISNNVIGAPININVGGQQQADGSLGAGQKYTDRGVDEPTVNAPFGTMQDVQTTRASWTDGFPFSSSEPARGSSSIFLWIGGALIAAGAGFAFLRHRHGV